MSIFKRRYKEPEVVLPVPVDVATAPPIGATCDEILDWYSTARLTNQLVLVAIDGYGNIDKNMWPSSAYLAACRKGASGFFAHTHGGLAAAIFATRAEAEAYVRKTNAEYQRAYRESSDRHTD
jgi:hypothetical protein